jgi:hypothetical protein
MDIGEFNLFIKLVSDEYKLNHDETTRLSRRLLADDKEFERVWNSYKSKSSVSGVDHFKALLQELIT